MAMAGNDEPLTDFDMGIVSALATVMEIFLAQGIEPSILAEPLEFQRDAHRAAGRVNAVVALELLIDGVRDPNRAKQRQIRRLFEQAPPEGTA